MIIVRCEQRSEEWFKARAGVCTASMFSVAREKLKNGKNKGNFSKASHNYAFRLAIERISGEPLDNTYENEYMLRGVRLEPYAEIEYEVLTGLLVEKAGLVLTDDRLFGASADGLIDNDGGCEWKCFLNPEKLREFYIQDEADTVIDQVQGCLWITEREWWDVGIYCPALAPIGRQFRTKRFYRDDGYIETLKKDLVDFYELVYEYERKLRDE